MKDASFEQLWVLLIFVLFPLVQFFVERLRRGAVIQPADEETSTPPQEQTPSPGSLAAATRWEPIPSSPTAPVRSKLAPRQVSRRALLGSKQDLRRAIVFNTILGPCRTDDPPANAGDPCSPKR